MITSSSPPKIDQHDNFPRCKRVTVTMVRNGKIRTALRTNQIAEFVTMHF